MCSLPNSDPQVTEKAVVADDKADKPDKPATTGLLWWEWWAIVVAQRLCNKKHYNNKSVCAFPFYSTCPCIMVPIAASVLSEIAPTWGAPI